MIRTRGSNRGSNAPMVVRRLRRNERLPRRGRAANSLTIPANRTVRRANEVASVGSRSAKILHGTGLRQVDATHPSIDPPGTKTQLSSNLR